MFQSYQLSTVLFLYVAITKGFNLFGADKKISRTISINSSNSPNSYLNLLQQAKAAKQMGQTQAQRPPVNSPWIPASTSLDNVISQAKANDAVEDDGLPFSDELYEHLKYVIGKITNRIKFGTPLNSDEVIRFESSAAAIIADSKKTVEYAVLSSLPHDVHADSVTFTVPPPECPASQYVTQSESEFTVTSPASFSVPPSQAIPGGPVQSGEPDVFSPLYGMKSTWQVPGMETMTTAEYYDAINKRNSEIKALMKARPDYDRNPGASYLESLNKK